MRWAKKVLRSSIGQKILGLLISGYLLLIKTTGNWSIESEDIPKKLIDKNQPFIVAFWHGRLLMFITAWKFPSPISIVISQHRDGKLISSSVAPFGISSLAGSTTRGGSQVLRKLIRTVKNGQNVGITPDGPQGPRMRATAGVIEAARLSEAPIVPLALSAKSAITASSWDRLLIPLPFCRGILLWGPPIFVPRNIDKDQVTRLIRELEDRLNRMTHDLDSRLGRPLIEPEKVGIEGKPS
jgi:lysophospholipid acyltransferase (LPLAT)-like uncharacterized protein